MPDRLANLSPDVARLAVEPPRVVLTRRQRFERAIAYLAILFSVFAFTLSTVAIEKVGDQGNCTNQILGDRQKVSDTPASIEEASAIADWSQGLLGLFALPKNLTAEQKAAEAQKLLSSTSEFATHLAHASAELQANALYRAEHPLGKC